MELNALIANEMDNGVNSLSGSRLASLTVQVAAGSGSVKPWARACMTRSEKEETSLGNVLKM
eukprot:scaffold103861_cov25-Prasinocladus_malaysianus.AAC.1